MDKERMVFIVDELIVYMAKHLVNNPDQVVVTDGGLREDAIVYNLTIARAASAKEGKKVNIDII